MKVYINDMDVTGCFDDYISQDIADTKGNVVPFLDTVVLCGNGNFYDYTDAPWWQEASRVYQDMDCYTEEELMEKYGDKAAALIRINEDDSITTNRDAIFEVAKVLYPEDEFTSATLKGSSQGDWKTAYFRNYPKDMVRELEAYFFGEVVSIYTEDLEETVFLPYDELWEQEREGTLTGWISNMFSIPEKEIELYKSNGYKQEINWEKVEEEGVER